MPTPDPTTTPREPAATRDAALVSDRTRPSGAGANTAGAGAAGGVDVHRYLDPQTLVRLKNFELRAKFIVEGVQSGQHRSPYQGFSIEFAQHRPYVAGDDLRYLDWKVYGRSDKLHLKQYEQETNLDVMLLVDASGSMGYGSVLSPRGWRSRRAGETSEREGAAADRADEPGLRSTSAGSSSASSASESARARIAGEIWTKFDHATAVAGAIAYLALSGQDRIGLSVFDERVRTLMPPSSAPGQWRQVITALATTPAASASGVVRAIERTISMAHRRMLIVLVSDVMDDPATIRPALAKLRHRGHDLILFHILDRQEMRFDFRSPAPFEGLEGEGRLNVDPRALRRAYLDVLAEHCRLVEHAARQFNFDYHRLDSHEPLGPALAAYLGHRGAMTKRGRVR